MYISNYEYTNNSGYAYRIYGRVDLTIDDCNSSDLDNIQRLAKNGHSVQIYDRDSLKTARKSVYGIPKTEFIPNCADIDIKVKKVIYHNPATIIFWSDGTKTVVKCGKDDTYDKEKGFYIACAKKLFGNDYKAVGRMNKALTMAETKEV